MNEGKNNLSPLSLFISSFLPSRTPACALSRAQARRVRVHPKTLPLKPAAPVLPARRERGRRDRGGQPKKRVASSSMDGGSSW